MSPPPTGLERGTGPDLTLEERLMALTPQARLFLGLTLELDKAVGEIEELVDVVRRQPVDPEQTPVRERASQPRRF
jgi:hypothetical protein